MLSLFGKGRSFLGNAISYLLQNDRLSFPRWFVFFLIKYTQFIKQEHYFLNRAAIFLSSKYFQYTNDLIPIYSIYC